MTRNEPIILQLSLDILRKAMAGTPKTEGEIAALRLALRCLYRWCKDRTVLTAFWERVHAHYDIGREQGVAAAYRAVVAELEQPVAEAKSYLTENK